MKKILILFAHPNYQRSHANKALLQALRKVEGITIHDLYQRYPSMFIDVAQEQQLLLEHDIIIFQHPLYWYSCPAIIKEWMDQVLEYGFAFGPQGHALKGKALLSAITTGGSQESYTSQGHNRRAVIEYLLPSSSRPGCAACATCHRLSSTPTTPFRMCSCCATPHSSIGDCSKDCGMSGSPPTPCNAPPT